MSSNARSSSSATPAAGDPGTVARARRGRRRGRRGGGGQRAGADRRTSACGSGCGACPRRAGRSRSSRSSSGTAPTGGAPIRRGGSCRSCPSATGVPARLQPRPQSVLRLQLGVSLSRALAGEHDPGAGRGGRALRGERAQVPSRGPRHRRRGETARPALGAWIARCASGNAIGGGTPSPLATPPDHLARGTLARRT